MEVPIEHCTSAKVYKPDPVRKVFFISLMIAMYAFSIPFCYNTAGEPRKAAMLHAQQIADAKWFGQQEQDAVANVTGISSGVGDFSLVGAEGETIFGEYDVDGDAVQFIELDGDNDITSTQRKDKFTTESAGAGGHVDEFGEPSEHGTSVGSGTTTGEKSKDAGPSWIMSWFTESKEQKRARQEFETWQKEFKEKSGDTVSLPPEYLPSAWACLALFASLSLHALFHLLGHWLVSFKALSLFKATKKIEEGCFVVIEPPTNRGSPAMVPLEKSATNPGCLQADFQRQQYIYTPADKLGSATNAAKYPNGVFTLSAYPVALSIETYMNSTGMANDTEIQRNTAKWGKNHLAVAVPSFFELLRLQLLSPLAIFQVFCALLWLLDEYWSYTLFTLASVLIFEATTVFQRSRTQSMLGGMAPKPTPIFAYRCGKWTMVTTKDLLPGDLISLAYKKRSNGNGSGNNNNAEAAANAASSASPAIKAKETSSEKEKNSVGSKASAAVSYPTTWDDIVPCDCVLLRGSAVVNEASLTGESVPQMKEALTYARVAASSSSKPAKKGSKASSRSKKTAPLITPVGVDDDDKGGAGEGGESVAAAVGSSTSEKLDINGVHRVSVLFSGSNMITVEGKNIKELDGDDDEDGEAGDDGFGAGAAVDSIIAPPDGGAIGFVMRTGFGSSQGSLLQMIEFSQQSVSGDAKETGMALLLLLIFALAASGYVLKEGLAKKEKTTHELLLKCVIILTSVVPRQFPMQMAMAVNMALMALTKAGIFCTEPFRVPISGKVTHCLFDKTGTLTTDQLVPVGVINYGHRDARATAARSELNTSSAAHSDDIPALTDVINAREETAMILAACHSLVVVTEGVEEAAGSHSSSGAVEAAPKAVSGASATLVGDPIELAAIKGIDWSWNGLSSTATPDGKVKRQEAALAACKSALARMGAIPAASRSKSFESDKMKCETEIASLQNKLTESREAARTAHKFSKIHVVQRHHFSSALQRMSVLAQCTLSTNEGGSSSSQAPEWYCLVKGSPEALKTLCVPSTLPEWYSTTYETLARRGLRVLALAYKKVIVSDPEQQPRSWVESELTFGGFIAFECKIRADSAVVIQSLRESDHKVAMLTGDALLTSLHVANAVKICDAANDCLTLTVPKKNDSSSSSSLGPLYWQVYSEKTGSSSTLPFDFSFEPKAIQALGEKYNLVSTEDSFNAAIAAIADLPVAKEAASAALAAASATAATTNTKEITLLSSPMWRYASVFRVLARMSPQGKASVIRAIQSNSPGDAYVFMCGDGGNDVGALKQADIGLALLSGHANANTTEEIDSELDKVPKLKDAAPTVVAAAAAPVTESTVEKDGKSAEDLLNAREKKLKYRNEAFTKLRAAHMKEFQKKYTAEQQVILQKKIAEKTEQGEYMAMFSLMKDQAANIKKAMAEENRRFSALHGQVYDPKKDGDGTGAAKGTMESLMESMDGADATGGMAMVRPGDASVAAPFTSRIPSVGAVVTLIRQGRCTLLSALMQQQIMMLESIIAAYTLSALSLHNARSSERQMMASSWLIMTAAVSFSYASPLDHMHPLRPLRSLFHPAMILSTLGQAAIHIACMSLAVKWATDAMGPDTLKEVTEFFRKAKAKEIDASELCAEDDFMCEIQAYWAAPFMPNLLNSTVFLVETSQMISVFFANYKGRPWMKGMMENHALFLSVFGCIGGCVVMAWEFVPQLNDLIQLAPFPDDAYRYKVIALVSATIAGTFVWDRLCTLIFAPEVFKVSLEEAKKTSLKDLTPILMTVVKIVAVMFILGTGNILLAGGAFYMYRQYSNKLAAAEAEAALKS